jgi:hypothetical protein
LEAKIRNFFIWLFGTVGAFLVTAGAFLLLANLGSNASEHSLEPASPSSSNRPPLELTVNRDRLKSLEALPDQQLMLVVANQSQSTFSKVSLTLRVSSEDTTLTNSRYYQASVNELKAGESEEVEFPLDLSPISAPRGANISPANGQERRRILLEVQATTPEGVSAIKTAVLPFSGDST